MQQCFLVLSESVFLYIWHSSYKGNIRGKVMKKILVVILLLSCCLAGCSKKEKIIMHMESTYEDSFEYIERVNSVIGDDSYTIKLFSSKYEEPVLASYQNKKNHYIDNYLAIQYHEDAFKKIDAVIKNVLCDYDLFFQIPDVLLDRNYCLEDYMEDPFAFKSIRIISDQPVNEFEIDCLMENFVNEKISVKGIIAVPVDKKTPLTEEVVDVCLANPDRVEQQINFKVENGQITKNVIKGDVL